MAEIGRNPTTSKPTAVADGAQDARGSRVDSEANILYNPSVRIVKRHKFHSFPAPPPLRAGKGWGEWLLR